MSRESKAGGSILFLFFLMATLSACISNTTNSKTAADDLTLEKQQEKKILNIGIEHDASRTSILISGNTVLNYAAVKQLEPRGVIMHFPDTSIDLEGPLLNIESDQALIKSLDWTRVGDKQTTCRIEILLNNHVAYTESREGNDIRFSFYSQNVLQDQQISDGTGEQKKSQPGQQAASVASDPGSPASRIDRIEVRDTDETVSVEVAADGWIENFKTFTINTPPRIVVDIFEITGKHQKEQRIPVNRKGVKQVRYYSYPDRLRLVVDTEAQYLSKFVTQPVENGLRVHVGTDESDMAVTTAAAASASSETPPAGVRSASVNRIDFLTEDAGKSVVIVETTHPVQFDIRRTADKHIELKLLDTVLPAYRRRPLITSRFESAVDRILPVQASDKNEALFGIDLREAVPYQIEQNGPVISVRFEASSIMPLRPGQKMAMDLPVGWQGGGVADTTAVNDNRKNTASAASEPEPSRRPKYTSQEKKIYTGEKIALDFYDTDIKNVFRILNSVSGKNFAIDKDVSGKVTMSLEKPVPWDQVLDLILRMNQLGTVEEGDIIRIATLGTLKKEEDLRRAKMESERKSREQQKALEPLITEYISINYSNANKDVRPHLEKLVTSGRGSISVDERTNQIIMTDTAEKIDKAWEIVRKIDQVTPQVIIEARIVEVSEDFSKDLGIAWSSTIGPTGPNDFKFDTAFNYPVASDSTIGFELSSIKGTPFVLNAQLTAAETEGEAEVISSPKIITLDNTQATISQGLEVAYLERDDSGGSSVKFKKVDLKLEVTPHVTPDNRIDMQIAIQKNDVESISADGVPVLSTNDAETELLIDDGDTIVIGGVVKTTKSRGKNGLPVLADIPMLGALFKSTSDATSKNELLIFITPRIVRLEQRS